MDVLADSGILLRLLEPTDPHHVTVEQAVRLLQRTRRPNRNCSSECSRVLKCLHAPDDSKRRLRAQYRWDQPAAYDHWGRVHHPVWTARCLPQMASARDGPCGSREAGPRRSACGPDAITRDFAHPDTLRLGLHSLPRHCGYSAREPRSAHVSARHSNDSGGTH